MTITSSAPVPKSTVSRLSSTPGGIWDRRSGAGDIRTKSGSNDVVRTGCVSDMDMLQEQEEEPYVQATSPSITTQVVKGITSGKSSRIITVPRRDLRYASWARATNVVKGDSLRNSLHVYDQRKRSPTRPQQCHRHPPPSSSRRRPERHSPSTLLWCPMSRRRLTRR
jgi:hypothetical protein